MGEVIIDRNLEDKLYNLVFTLYKKEYFGFMESAFNYVDKVIDFFYSIPSQKYKYCYNKKFGAFYCSYKANEITNNHCGDYAYVLSLIK